MAEEKKLTGYPSIDKPWLKYHSEEAINVPLPECTMYQYVWENNKEHLSDVALRYYGTKITYGKLFESIKKAADAFYSMGVRTGDIVTVMSMHTPEAIFAIYGLNYIGAVANMVYMTLSEKEIIETLENTNSKLFLVLDVALARINRIKDKLRIPVIVLGVSDSMPFFVKVGYRLKKHTETGIFIPWKRFLSEVGTPAPLAVNHSAPAVIVYTSGTTGKPKGVVLGNDAINAHSSQERCEMYGLKRRLRFLLILPPFIGFGITKLNVALNAGVDIELWIELQAEKIVNAFFAKKPEIFVAGPALVDAFLHHKAQRQEHLKLFVGGGGAISMDKEKEFNTFLSFCHPGCIYANGYGMTEGGSTLCGSSNTTYKTGSVGIPLPKTNVKVIDTESGEPLPYGEIGELCFSTPDMMTGYYNDQISTEEVLHKDDEGTLWLHTGDLGYVDSDGFIYIQGRIKRIYITRGDDGMAYKLFPQHIEEYYQSIAEVKQCAVIVREVETSVYSPIVFVTIEKLSVEKGKEKLFLMKTGQAGLPSHEQPLSVIILDSMPMTPSGKIDYRALEEMAKEM